MKFDMILAVDDKNWIWKSWDLAWSIKADMQYFKDTTSNTKNPNKRNAVIMWYKTWISIPEKSRPLSNRLNCILTRSLDWLNDNENELFFLDFDECFNFLSNNEDVESIFVIWWATIYNKLLDNKNLDKIYLTKIKWDFDCDVFFDWIPKDFTLISETPIQKEWNIEFSFQIYKKNT